MDLCQLPVSPSKCWFWAVQPSDRKRLRNALFLGHKVPVKLQARELGADISYCKRKAAKERNLRTTSGLRRLHKLAGLPGSVGRKTRLLVTGVFPHALHAAEHLHPPSPFCSGYVAVLPSHWGVVPKALPLGLLVCSPPIVAWTPSSSLS